MIYNEWGGGSDDDTPKGCGNRLRIWAMIGLIGAVIWRVIK